MESKKISTEDDLLAHYLKNYIKKKDRFRFFPKVHTISTLRISPDIDLLQLSLSLNLVIGYEFKVLKYYEHWKRKKVNYNPMYAGIGEALLYFQHGIDKCYLVLGVTEMPPPVMDIILQKIEQAIDIFHILTRVFTVWWRENRALTQKHNVLAHYIKSKEKSLGNEKEHWGFGCFGVMVWTERGGLKVIKNADQRFPISEDSDLMHKKECLLRKEFRYKKRFLKKVFGDSEG